MKNQQPDSLLPEIDHYSLPIGSNKSPLSKNLADTAPFSPSLRVLAESFEDMDSGNSPSNRKLIKNNSKPFADTEPHHVITKKQLDQHKLSSTIELKSAVTCSIQ